MQGQWAWVSMTNSWLRWETGRSVITVGHWLNLYLGCAWHWLGVFSCHTEVFFSLRSDLVFACIQLIIFQCVRIWLPLYSRKLESSLAPVHSVFWSWKTRCWSHSGYFITLKNLLANEVFINCFKWSKIRDFFTSFEPYTILMGLFFFFIKNDKLLISPFKPCLPANIGNVFPCW